MTLRSIPIADMWMPWRWPARLIVGSFVAMQFLQAAGAVVENQSPALTIVSFLCFLTAAFILTSKYSGVLPARVSALVVALSIAMTVLQAEFWHTVQGRFVDWYLGAVVIVLLGLMMWGRVAAAWWTFVAIAAIQIIWSALLGVGIEVTGPIMLRHAATLLVATGMVRGFRNVGRRLIDSANRREQRDAEAMTRIAVERERDEQFSKIDAISGAMMRRIAQGEQLTEAERAECLLVEASLRDTMSGRGLATPEVIQAARSARERGARVVLLDDSRGMHPEADRAVDALLGVLSEMQGGLCTMRLMSVDRERVATILVDDGVNARVIDVEHSQ